MQQETRFCITDSGVRIKNPIGRHLQGVVITMLVAVTSFLTIGDGHAQVMLRSAPTILPPARATQPLKPHRERSLAQQVVCPLLNGVECGNRGTCNRNSSQCLCYAGFSGPACQYNNTMNCSNQGVVQQDGTCSCVTGVTGYACQRCVTNHYSYPTCRYCLASTTCSNHGNCNSTSQRNCHPGFGGADCSTRN